MASSAGGRERSWFRVSLSADRTVLLGVGSLCQGLARYAGFDHAQAAELGALLEAALQKAAGRGHNTTAPLVDITCSTGNGQFEAVVAREGRPVETIVRGLPQDIDELTG